MDVIKYHAEDEVHFGLLVKTTPKKVHVLLIGAKLAVQKLPIAEMKYITVLDNYKVSKVKDQMWRIAKDKHLKLSAETKGALRR